MTLCFFVSDLHGRRPRYQSLFEAIRADRPAAVFWGGDLLPSGLLALMGGGEPQGFVRSLVSPGLRALREELGDAYPRQFLIPGNDDGRAEEDALEEAEAEGLIEYIPLRTISAFGRRIHGYPYVPPTPFQLKDWERYDVSRFVDPGCMAPEEGWRTRDEPVLAVGYPSIKTDLAELAGEGELDDSVFLFHAPPYRSSLDRAALDGHAVDHCPLDVNVGSIAIKEFIEQRQPALTLHGHVHESARLTGVWKEKYGRTVALSAAHDGPELALVRFELEEPFGAVRELR